MGGLPSAAREPYALDVQARIWSSFHITHAQWYKTVETDSCAIFVVAGADISPAFACRAAASTRKAMHHAPVRTRQAMSSAAATTSDRAAAPAATAAPAAVHVPLASNRTAAPAADIGGILDFFKKKKKKNEPAAVVPAPAPAPPAPAPARAPMAAPGQVVYVVLPPGQAAPVGGHSGHRGRIVGHAGRQQRSAELAEQIRAAVRAVSLSLRTDFEPLSDEPADVSEAAGRQAAYRALADAVLDAARAWNNAGDAPEWGDGLRAAAEVYYGSIIGADFVDHAENINNLIGLSADDQTVAREWARVIERITGVMYADA